MHHAITSHCNEYPPCEWEQIQNQLNEDSTHELWAEMTENYCAMLAKHGKAFGDYLANDPITTRTADDFVIDPCGKVACLVEDYYGIREWLRERMIPIREEDDEYEEEEDDATAESTIPTSLHSASPSAITTSATESSITGSDITASSSLPSFPSTNLAVKSASISSALTIANPDLANMPYYRAAPSLSLNYPPNTTLTASPVEGTTSLPPINLPANPELVQKPNDRAAPSSPLLPATNDSNPAPTDRLISPAPIKYHRRSRRRRLAFFLRKFFCSA